jgi:H+-transporting ATPase
MLEAAIVFQIALHEYVGAAVIAALLVFNALLGFFQEGRAGAVLAALKKRLAPTALVLRDGTWRQIPAAELVPGDAIQLALGAMVPADATVVSGSLLVDQSMLTGESVPVETETGGKVFAGALVRRGQALAEVTATGAATYFGRTAELVRIAKTRSTEQVAILKVTRNLIILNGVIGSLAVLAGQLMGLPAEDLVRIALTALLATVPVALPATFTLSAAFTAQILSRRGVLLTRLSAAHEAAAMDVLCADKTGTLTRNALEVVDVVAAAEHDRESVLGLAAMAGSDAGGDPIDSAISTAAARGNVARAPLRLLRFVPFDPATRMSEAVAAGPDGEELRIVKGAYATIVELTGADAMLRQQADELAARGHRVIAVATGSRGMLRLAGFIAISDPPREDSAELITTLHSLGVRTVMVTGDSPVTAEVIANKVGIKGGVCTTGAFGETAGTLDCGVFARVLPEGKYRLVQALQLQGHVVGMCGDGANDAPALRQAQIGIAVSTATDVAKAAAGMVMTEPGLHGIVFAVREGRVAFQRVLTYALNMLVKKIEIVLFMTVGLIMTGHPVITPVGMVLLFVTNDFLSMSLTTDRSRAAAAPAVWHMRRITAAALVFGLCKLAFSISMLAFGQFRLGLDAAQIQAMAFVTLVFGNQAVMYALRERGPLWASRPGTWVIVSSAVDIALVSALAASGILVATLPWSVLAFIAAAAAAFMLLLDRIKLPVFSRLRIG